MSFALLTIPGSSEDIPPLWPVRVLRYLLPIVVAILVTAFEYWEHWNESQDLRVDHIDLAEVFIFGVIGAIVIFLTISYVDRLLRDVDQSRTRFIALNNDLEALVEQRTVALQESNQQLSAVNHRLRELDELKSDFVAMVSHELNAPLATLSGGLEVTLQDEAKLPSRAQRILRMLFTETQHLTRFVETMLDLSQLDAGKIHLTPGPAAIRPILAHAVEVVLGPDLQRVQWQLPSDLPPIVADEIYLEQILRNLLQNALKHAPAHSPIELSAKVRNHSVQISVIDHGPGISPVEQNRIFDRFYRTSHSYDRKVSGWGLGLYFSRALTEAQGGTLTVHSPVHANPDAPGACFTVTLPIAEEGPDNGETLAD